MEHDKLRLYVDGQACGIFEAKKERSVLNGVSEQSPRYATSGVKHTQRIEANAEFLSFLYQAIHHEISFRDQRDTHNTSKLFPL